MLAVIKIRTLTKMHALKSFQALASQSHGNIPINGQIIGIFRFGQQIVGSIFTRQLANFKNKFYWKPYRFKANRKPKFPVILLEDNERLGRKGELVKVERGLARTVLLPENKVDYATRENLEKYKVMESKSLPRASLKLINKISKIHLNMKRPKEEKWEISKHHVALSLDKVFKLHVPVHCMEMDSEAIQEFGDYTVNITINSETTVPIKVTVEEWQPVYKDGWKEILEEGVQDISHELKEET